MLSHKTAVVRPPTSYLKNYPNHTNRTYRTLLEKLGQTQATFSSRPLHMDEHVEHIYNSSVWTQDVV